MVKGHVKDSIIKLIFAMLGLISGFLFCFVFVYYPDFRVFLFAVLALAILFVLLLIEKIKNHIRFETHIKNITKSMKNAESGNIKIEPTEEEKEINGISAVYDSVENIRKNLKEKLIIQRAALDIINTLATNIELESLIDGVMARLVEEMGSNWGVFYLYNKQTGKMQLKKSLGLSKNIYKEFDIAIGEGFIGLTAQTKEIKIFRNIPEDTKFENKTFLGKILPKSVLAVPVTNCDELRAVIAFGSIYDFSDAQLKLIRLLKNYLGFAVSNCLAYEKTQRLTKELQFQNQLIQNMNDELEKKVGERTDFLNGIIDSIHEYMIVSVDKGGFIVTWNKGAEAIRGYKAEEVIGNHISCIYDDTEQKEKLSDYFDIAKKEGEFTVNEWQTRRDGTKYYADVVVTPIYGKTGDLKGFTNITKDITFVKNLEKKLHEEKAFNDKIIKSNCNAIVLINSDGKILNYNTVSQRLLVPRDIEISGKQFSDFFLEKESLTRNMRNICLSSGMGEFVNELYYKHEEIEKLRIKAISIGNGSESAGVLIYLMQE